MIIFILNYLTSAIEVFKMAKSLRGLIIPCLFFAVTLAGAMELMTDTRNELLYFAFCIAFVLKFLCGGIRIAAQIWGNPEAIFYFFTLIETIFLWWFLNDLF